MSRLTLSARAHGANIYPLAFHVAYWNDLGWEDPFSSGTFTLRQEVYAEKIKARQVYTPQMIINGTAIMRISDHEAIAEKIESSLKNIPQSGLRLKITSVTDKSVNVHYETENAPPGSLLNLALVERGLVTDIRGGENAGITLRQDNVVRVFRSVKLTGDDKGGVELENEFPLIADESSVIGFIQRQDTLAIVSADMADLK